MNHKEIVIKLKEFNVLINNYFDGKYTDKKEITSKINNLLPIAQDLVVKAETLKIMTMAPPPAIGGMVIQNFNPFDMIFTDMWGRSIIPDISDMIEQAIGKYEQNLVNIEQSIKQCNIPYPEKITFNWLFDNVPIKMWAISFGLLITFFGLGFKMSEILHNTGTIKSETTKKLENK